MQNQRSEQQLQAVRSAVKSGEKIKAVKLYREITGTDLLKAKQYVDNLASELAEADGDAPGMSEDALIVGLGGTHNTIRIVRTGESLVCRLSASTRALVVGALVMFGPGVLSLLWIQPEGWGVADLTKAPWYLAALILFIPVICCPLLLWHLIRNPRIVVPLATGEVQFYTRRGGRPVRRIERQEIERFEIEEGSYVDSDGDRTQQWTLYLITRRAARIALCLSTKEVLIRSFCRDLENLTGKRQTETKEPVGGGGEGET
jgi:hypothetical protein